MPHQSSGPPDGFGKDLQKKLAKRKKKLNRTTRLLCSLCGELQLSSLGSLIRIIENGELDEWWGVYKKLDAQRKDREIIKNKARAKQKKKAEKKKMLGVK